MKRAATNEKQFAAVAIEQFAHGADAGVQSLTQWWEKPRQQLAPFGCDGCAAKAAHPNPPSQEGTFPACGADSLPQVLIPVYYLDDGSEADVDEGASESELAAEDAPALNLYNAAVPPRARPRPVSEPAAPAKKEEARPAPSAYVPPPNLFIGRPPAGEPYIPEPD